MKSTNAQKDFQPCVGEKESRFRETVGWFVQKASHPIHLTKPATLQVPFPRDSGCSFVFYAI